jgi:hypothetical protein
MFEASDLSKIGTKSALLGKIYEIAVNATKQVSATISGGDYINYDD